MEQVLYLVVELLSNAGKGSCISEVQVGNGVFVGLDIYINTIYDYLVKLFKSLIRAVIPCSEKSPRIIQ